VILDVSGLVNIGDLAIIDTDYGTRSIDLLPSLCDWRADINLNGSIELGNLALAGLSNGYTFNFHFQRRASNGCSGGASAPSAEPIVSCLAHASSSTSLSGMPNASATPFP
jgi:hypothetical protein